MSFLGSRRPGEPEATTLTLEVLSTCFLCRGLTTPGQVGVLGHVFTNHHRCGEPAFVQCRVEPAHASLSAVLRRCCPSMSDQAVQCLERSRQAGGHVRLPLAVFRQMSLAQHRVVPKALVWTSIIAAWSDYGADRCAACPLLPLDECPRHYCSLCDLFSLLLGAAQEVKHSQARQWCERAPRIDLLALSGSSLRSGPPEPRPALELCALMNTGQRGRAASLVAARLAAGTRRSAWTTRSLSVPRIRGSSAEAVFLGSGCWMDGPRLSDESKRGAFREMVGWFVQLPFLATAQPHADSGWGEASCAVCLWEAGHTEVTAGDPVLAQGVPVQVTKFIAKRRRMGATQPTHALFAWALSVTRLLFVPGPQAYLELCLELAPPLLRVSAHLVLGLVEAELGALIVSDEQRDALADALAVVWADYMLRVWTKVYDLPAADRLSLCVGSRAVFEPVKESKKN